MRMCARLCAIIETDYPGSYQAAGAFENGRAVAMIETRRGGEIVRAWNATDGMVL
jgi:hypothetical protein